jgi:hypothetical protein
MRIQITRGVLAAGVLACAGAASANGDYPFNASAPSSLPR